MSFYRVFILFLSDKVKLTGNKLEDKKYYNHSGFPGGLRERNAAEMIESYPEEMVERAIKGMLPHNRLGRASLLLFDLYFHQI